VHGVEQIARAATGEVVLRHAFLDGAPGWGVHGASDMGNSTTIVPQLLLQRNELDMSQVLLLGERRHRDTEQGRQCGE
jgi:hypothetical protein